MLNDWGVHHFHLGTRIESKGFVNRTGPLLYARVLPDRVLCLQIADHRAWADSSLVEIWLQNWPDTLAPYRIRGFKAGRLQPSNHALQRLRGGGVFTPLQTKDGELFFPPGGGIATSGHSAEVINDSHHYASLVAEFEHYVRDHAEEIVVLARSEGYCLQKPLAFRLRLNEGVFTVEEEKSRWRFRITVAPDGIVSREV